MTNSCKPNTNCCRVCDSYRYDVQYKDGKDWILYGSTKDSTGGWLRERLEGKGKEVRVVDTEEGKANDE